jgi:signal transduction histidine kinase
LVLLCLGLIVLTTVRLARSQTRARLLELEAAHLRELGQAAAGLAHETRTPLGLIRGWMQRLASAEQPASSELAEQAQAVIEECDRLTARINQFLAFAKPSAAAPQAVDVAALADELALLLQPDLEAKRVNLRCKLTAVQRVWADRELLRQALFNLVHNAVQASPENTEVEILYTSGGNGGGRVEVADRGPGVAAEAVPRLFTPYYTTRPGGTGLGLAIVRRIAVVHGWRCGYTSRPEGGAIFWLDGIQVSDE